MTDITCPISLQPMTDPVTDDDGTNYDRASIEAWLRNNNTSPITRNPITRLIPNRLLKDQIERFMSSHVVANDFVMPMFKECVLDVKKTWSNGQLHVQIKPPATGPADREGVVIGVGVDNSGSMETLACNIQETGGNRFTRLDLTIHTVRSIIGMLGPKDMLYIVKFSSAASLVMAPTVMNAEGKEKATLAISSIYPEGSTNIWDCLKMLNFYANKFPGRNVITALLTDGVANITPPKGVLASLKSLDMPESLSTFGFGYELDSKLLTDISSQCLGSFGFIPDYSMVGTVFINWCATALSTASLNKAIDIGGQLYSTGLLQYGQTRDFLVPMATKPHDAEEGPIDELVLARDDLLKAMRTCIGTEGREGFTALYRKYAASTNAAVIELMKDVKPPGSDDEGQIHMAPSFWQTWGKHYLRSILSAHMNQICMNFKDSGLQGYGGEMFREFRELGDKVFCDLPALVGTGGAYGGAYAIPTQAPQQPVDMSHLFNNQRGGCFKGECEVLMADGTRMPIWSITKGAQVWTPEGPATVELHLTLGSYNKFQPMCRIGKLFITPWHPILVDNVWTFPSDIYPIEDRIMPIVYNLVLSNGHIIDIEGTLSITLGHEMTTGLAKHQFFGSKKRILEALKKQPGFVSGHPVFYNLTVVRDPESNEIIDWTDKV